MINFKSSPKTEPHIEKQIIRKLGTNNLSLFLQPLSPQESANDAPKTLPNQLHTLLFIFFQKSSNTYVHIALLHFNNNMFTYYVALASLCYRFFCPSVRLWAGYLQNDSTHSNFVFAFLLLIFDPLSCSRMGSLGQGDLGLAWGQRPSWTLIFIWGLILKKIFPQKQGFWTPTSRITVLTRSKVTNQIIFTWRHFPVWILLYNATSSPSFFTRLLFSLIFSAYFFISKFLLFGTARLLKYLQTRPKSLALYTHKSLLSWREMKRLDCNSWCDRIGYFAPLAYALSL